MGIFHKKDSSKTRTHRILTGIIIGGAVGSALSLYGSHKKKIADSELADPDMEEDIDEELPEELSCPESIETQVAKKAARPVRRGLKTVAGATWSVTKAIFRLLEKMGQKTGN